MCLLCMFISQWQWIHDVSCRTSLWGRYFFYKFPTPTLLMHIVWCQRQTPLSQVLRCFAPTQYSYDRQSFIRIEPQRSVRNSYLSSLKGRSSWRVGGIPIDWSLFMETQLGPGGSALSCCPGLQNNTDTQLLLRLMKVSWCLTAELWGGQQSQTVRDPLLAPPS